MNLHFSGRNALILGGSCDLAMCLAECMIESSLFPILTYRSEKGEKRIFKKLENYSDEYSSSYLDFGRRDSLDSLFGKTGDDIDFVIDFAQGDLESFIAAADADSMFHYFSENVSFRAEILKRVSRAMLKKQRGRLIFISSTAALRPNPGQGFYSAAKLASEALYKNLGLELGGRGIITVTLRPGYIDAGRGRQYLQSHEKEVLKMVPINRAISEKEVVETILFLLSDSARGFNATEITMDGGLTAGK
jgi:3-oxoacyl-[acyl-carrier protein] reductase